MSNGLFSLEMLDDALEAADEWLVEHGREPTVGTSEEEPHQTAIVANHEKSALHADLFNTAFGGLGAKIEEAHKPAA